MKPSRLFLSMLMAWAVCSAEARVIDSRPPVSMNLPKQQNLQAIALQKLAVDVEVLPALAQTQLTMTFHNPNRRPLEGELVVPLLEGQKNHRHGFGHQWRNARCRACAQGARPASV